MKINPVYKKELKTSVRTVKLAMTVLGYNALLALIGLFALYLTVQEASQYGRIEYSNVFIIYTVIASIEMMLVLFVVPAFTSGAISGERERQTLDILLTTKLTPAQIIIGKLASSISSTLLLIVSSLPILSIVFVVGGIGLRDIFQLIIVAVVTAIFVGSIGIFFSVLFKRTIPATVFNYGMILFLTIGTIMIVWGTLLAIAIGRVEWYDNAGNYISRGVGHLLMLLLINPIFTIVSMMTQQFGNYTGFVDFMSGIGETYPFILENWFIISIITQLLLSVLIIFAAIKLLNPIKMRKKQPV